MSHKEDFGFEPMRRHGPSKRELDQASRHKARISGSSGLGGHFRQAPRSERELILSENPLPVQPRLKSWVPAVEQPTLDFRNQVFKVSEKFHPAHQDEMGELVDDYSTVELEGEHAFYSCNVVMPTGRISLGEYLESKESHEFFFTIYGIISKRQVNFDNRNHMGPMLYSAGKLFGVDPFELKLVWFNRQTPCFYHPATQRMSTIFTKFFGKDGEEVRKECVKRSDLKSGVVREKAVGFDTNLVKIR